MTWEETVASKCRYGDVASRIFAEANIIFEHSEDDYQGFANVLAAMPDGTFVHYEWSYGSCSGCDEWEAADLSDDQIEQAMRQAMAVLPDRDALLRYCKLEGEYAEPTVPTANKGDNASIPGMLRTLSAGAGTDFEHMGNAVRSWLAKG